MLGIALANEEHIAIRIHVACEGLVVQCSTVVGAPRKGTTGIELHEEGILLSTERDLVPQVAQGGGVRRPEHVDETTGIDGALAHVLITRATEVSGPLARAGRIEAHQEGVITTAEGVLVAAEIDAIGGI